MPEHYKLGERVRVIVEGLITHIAPACDAFPEELTVDLEHSAGPYGVTVPLDTVTIERLVPADGVPQPGEIWRDRHGTDWFAHQGYPPVALRATTGQLAPWPTIDRERGPLTKVYPAPVIVLDGGAA
ncbi:hypothetical protein [Streptosporangium sp. NPDC049376]|uniref:hypothetical protein n=1 Tax=Streptosporangium sp. NPDC049376 TaxID=3366192 RepID=UPI0037B6B5EB